MRYLVVLLLLASPAIAADPEYSWRTRADEPDQIYLYRDGNQVGGWSYSARQYRPFDGTNWGAPTATAPIKPPSNRVIVVPRPQPTVVIEPSLPPLRGPIRKRIATGMAEVVTDMTMRIIEEIPGAILKSLKEGNYQLKFESSVTPSAQQREAQTTPAIPNPPASSPQRRSIFPRR